MKVHTGGDFNQLGSATQKQHLVCAGDAFAGVPLPSGCTDPSLDINVGLTVKQAEANVEDNRRAFYVSGADLKQRIE